jgi:phosphate acyltransferase
MIIGLDMAGGDFAPEMAVTGVAAYLKANEQPATICCIGDEIKLQQLFADAQLLSKVTIVHAAQNIDYNEHPVKALKEKPQSSIAIGFGMLATGKIEAFISAGNTGAMLVGAAHIIKSIEGVLRPTIATILPKTNGGTGLLMDVGTNVDCKPEQLNQFGILGSLYAKHILDVETPRVALLNVGEEEGKGNQLAQATYPLLKENKHIHFVGNVEGRDLLMDKADVILCDGYTGNVVLKLLESMHDVTISQNVHNAYFDRFNFEQYGGVPVLGVAKPVIIGHGISGEAAFCNMIKIAEKVIATKLLDKMKESFVV